MPDRTAEVVVITGASAGIGRAAVREFAHRGTILQVGSALAYRSIPLQSPYCGARHAIKGCTQALRTELEHDHNKVHLVLVDMPGVNTTQFDWCKTTLHRHPRPTGRTSCGSRCRGPSPPTAASTAAPGPSARNSGRRSIAAGCGAPPRSAQACTD